MGTMSLMACYNHINQTACPNSYTDANYGTCTLYSGTTYDDPNDDGSGAAGKTSTKDKPNSQMQCLYNCDGYAFNVNNYGKDEAGGACPG